MPDKEEPLKKNPLNKIYSDLVKSPSTSKKISRKEFKVPSDTYKRITEAYEKYKGVKLEGAEYGEIRRAIKTILYSKRTEKNITDFMVFCSRVCKEIEDGDTETEKQFCWLQNWTMLTIKRKMPEFLAGKFQVDDIEIPEYAKKFNK